MNCQIQHHLIPRAHIEFGSPPMVDPRNLRCWRTVCVAMAELWLVALIAGMFWYQDWRYSLPTPKPPDLREPALGTVFSNPLCTADKSNLFDRPVLLHFFNPDCPCSRFNLDHLRKLHRQFAGRVNFVTVLEGTNSEQLRQQYARLDLTVPAIVDVDQSIANSLGVYSTPQAVVFDCQQRLCYRGNYNVSRYCTAPQTEFARLVLESLFQKTANDSSFPTAATITYGCSLPTCCRKDGTP